MADYAHLVAIALVALSSCHAAPPTARSRTIELALVGGRLYRSPTDPPIDGAEWKTAVRERILSARRALLRHPWASSVMESRTEPTPTVLAYMDSMIGIGDLP